MKHVFSTIFTLVFALVLTNTCSAQKTEFVDGMNRGFLKSAPKIGETVSNVSAFSESGEAFNLENMRGKHTVLIFGCLT